MIPVGIDLELRTISIDNLASPIDYFLVAIDLCHNSPLFLQRRQRNFVIFKEIAGNAC